jgi:hypothetical protein
MVAKTARFQINSRLARLLSQEYRHELSKHMAKPIRVLLIGGRGAPDFPGGQREAEVKAFAFSDGISSAQRAIDWQLSVQHF